MNHQTPTEEEVIIFTRYPQPGNVKTRLIPYLGKEEATRVHRLLTEQVVRHVLPLQQMRPVRLSLHYTGCTKEQMKNWLARPAILEKQHGADVGLRMAAALKEASARGVRRTVLIGTDCPSMNADLLAGALDVLLTHEVVLGPTFDGGYYLIGVNRNLPEEKIDTFFQDIAWGTSTVFRQTVRKLISGCISFATLKTLHDIDRPEDLEYFHNYTNPQ